MLFLVSVSVSTLSGCGLAGFQDGDSKVAKFNFPKGLALDHLGLLYVADSNNKRIRVVVTPEGKFNDTADRREGERDGEIKKETRRREGACRPFDHIGWLYVAD